MNADHASTVVDFYHSHPINEDEILAKLTARSANLEALSEDDLQEFDQDHYGGTQAVEALAAAARIRAGQHVLDICCGMGGPARWLAHRYGCRVTGVDLTPSRVAGAARLTARARLAHLVDFQQADATALPFTDAAFDAAIAQEAWCHIPDKSALVAEAVRVVRSGAVVAFTDIVLLRELSDEDRERLTAGMAIPLPARVDDYRRLFAERGCAIESCDDLSAQWAQILVGRLEMYRSLRDTTVAKFGQARYHEYDRAYSHYVGLFVAGRLGGVRFAARKP